MGGTGTPSPAKLARSKLRLLEFRRRKHRLGRAVLLAFRWVSSHDFLRQSLDDVNDGLVVGLPLTGFVHIDTTSLGLEEEAELCGPWFSMNGNWSFDAGTDLDSCLVPDAPPGSAPPCGAMSQLRGLSVSSWGPDDSDAKAVNPGSEIEAGDDDLESDGRIDHDEASVRDFHFNVHALLSHTDLELAKLHSTWGSDAGCHVYLDPSWTSNTLSQCLVYMCLLDDFETYLLSKLDWARVA
jgi:hypothetical protein